MSIDPVFCASAQTFLWLVYKGQPMSGFNSTTQVETRQVIPSPYLCSWFCIHYHRSSPEYLPRGYALFLGTPLGDKVLWFPLFFVCSPNAVVLLSNLRLYRGDPAVLWGDLRNSCTHEPGAGEHVYTWPAPTALQWCTGSKPLLGM